MARALDDPELKTKYQGPQPIPPDDTEKVPDREQDLPAYAAYARAQEKKCRLELEHWGAEIAWILNHCKHRQMGEWDFRPHQAEEYQDHYVICSICNACFSNVDAYQRFNYIRPQQAPVAQLDPEHQSTKLGVAGSNPAGRAVSSHGTVSGRISTNGTTFAPPSEDFEGFYVEIDRVLDPSFVHRIPQMAFQPPYQERETIPANSTQLSNSSRRHTTGYRGCRGK